MSECVQMPPRKEPGTQYSNLGYEFALHYYNTFCKQRPGLQALYTQDSVMTFEGSECSGREAILARLEALTFKSIQYSITSIDCQPTINQTAVFLMVLGQLKADEDPPHSFCQTFLLQQAEGSFFIANDAFRMVLHN